MKPLPVQSGIPAALFHFTPEGEKYRLVRKSNSDGSALIGVLGELWENGLRAHVAYTDYLLSCNGVNCDLKLQFDLAFAGTPRASFPNKGARSLRIESLSLEQPGVAGDTGTFFTSRSGEDVGLVLSPLIGIALAASMEVMLVTYDGATLLDGNLSALRIALRADIEKLHSSESPLFSTQVLNLTLDRIVGARALGKTESGLNVAAWKKPF